MEPSKKVRLLAVDDDEDARTLLEMAARRCAQFSEIRLANDGEHALAIINEIVRNGGDGLPELIVSDLRMPLVGGVELVRLLKESRRTKHIPVVLLTSSELPADRSAAKAAGCDGYYLKMSSVVTLAALFSALVEKLPANLGPQV